MTARKIDLLIIDPQRGFCDQSLNDGKGELFVPGSEDAVEKLGRFIDAKGDLLRDIDITLDSHHNFHIGHPIYWRNSTGERPPPFTVIEPADVRRGTWVPRVPKLHEYTINYLEALVARGRYRHTIWPPHCLIGTPGYEVMPRIMKALLKWEDEQVAIVGKHSKGSCPYTEHFSGVQAEVPYPGDPSTQLNVDLVRKLESADMILVAGWATSHCVANTIRDVANAFGDPTLTSKFVLLTDATNSVAGCEEMTKAFLAEFVGDRRNPGKGMKTATTTDIL